MKRFVFMFTLFFAVWTVSSLAQTPMSITQSDFGQTAGGKTVKKYTLDNGKGVTAEILSLGGVIYSFNVPDKTGKVANISANLATVAEYEKERPFFGSLIGRFGNRIAKGKFTLDGKEYTLPINNEPNALHGGLHGFDMKVWDVAEVHAPSYVGLELTYTAKDGEEGYPGNLYVKVLYKLGTDSTWTMDYTATTDKTTVVNLTNHTFWNLAGYLKDKEITKVYDHVLMLNAGKYLPTDDTLIPTGELKVVKGTPYDFTVPHKIGERIKEIKEECFRGGYDSAWVLNKDGGSGLTLVAEVYEPGSGRTMKIESTEPSVQFYSGNWLDGSTGNEGHKYEQHTAFCLETQHYPDSPNHPDFPSTVLKPGETFHSVTVHTFGTK